MDTFYAILIITGIIILVFVLPKLLGKGVNKAATVLNQKVFLKAQCQAGQDLVLESLAFDCKASLQDILSQLAIHVNPADVLPTVKSVIYKLSESPDNIVYAYGNKIYSQWFTAALSFISNDEATKGIFEFITWKETEGLVQNEEIMRKFREDVYSAFKSADPNVKITGTTKAKKYVK